MGVVGQINGYLVKEVEMKTLRLLSILLLGNLLLAGASYATDKCLTYHTNSNPALYLQWKDSGHGKNGIGCLDCHETEATDEDYH